MYIFFLDIQFFSRYYSEKWEPVIIIMIYYEIKNEEGETEDTELLSRFFGAVWRLALSRLNHECDGRVLTICLQGKRYSVYRRLKN